MILDLSCVCLAQHELKSIKHVVDTDNSSVYDFQLMMSFRYAQGITCLSRADHVKLK